MPKQKLETLTIIIKPANQPLKSSRDTEHPWGTFDPNTNTITLSGKVNHPYFVSALLHEMGHFYMKDTTPEDYKRIFGSKGVGYRRLGYDDNSQFKEDAADAFAKWSLSNNNGFYIPPTKFVSQPYYKYQNSPDVFEAGTNRHIEYAEAKKKNIWKKIQNLPVDNPTISQDQDNFFKDIVSNEVNQTFNPWEKLGY